MKYPKLNKHFPHSDISAGAYASNTATYTFVTISELFPQVISYTYAMPSASAEITAFTGTELSSQWNIRA